MTNNIKILLANLLVVSVLCVGCKDKKDSNKANSDKPQTQEKGPEPTTNNASRNFESPNFSDPELKAFYSKYTDYLKRVVTAIRSNDEEATMKLFREEGNSYNDRNEMDAKAKAADSEKFTKWLLETVPYVKEIVGSPYYKKYNDEYYKKVKEDFKKKGN